MKTVSVIKIIDRHTKLAVIVVILALTSACATGNAPWTQSTDSVVISVVGTNDVHGQLLPQTGRGGLALLSGYVDALRTVRARDEGAVLLIDAGDMWQGTLESNLSEGAAVLSAYNSIGFDAATIGNHEFDFGPVGELATPQNITDDARGALKKRASEANFPLLAANLIDVQTNEPVAWPNVQPAILIDVAGVKTGIIGVMTIDALGATIASNTVGLRVDPLADAIVREARTLRSQGATLVIVTAHAGGRCEEFGNPDDLSSCDPTGEIMQVAHALPVGLVDHIIAGHEHRGIAHVVNGIAITSAFAGTRAFDRVDFIIDKTRGTVLSRRVFPPQSLCPYIKHAGGECAWQDDDTVFPATYEGRPIQPNSAVVAIAASAEAQANKLKAEKIGVFLETPITLRGRPESALGNLMTDALLESSGADIALHNVVGGIRADLPAGELLYGSVYQMFPFDNRLVVIEVPGRDVRRIIERQAHNGDRRAGFAGIRVYVRCDNDQMHITMQLNNGRVIRDDDIISIAVNDFLALGGDKVLTPVMPVGGFSYPDDTPLARDVIVSWLRARGGHLRAEEFLDPQQLRWNLPEVIPGTCKL